jgi:hypothetical protein
MLDLWFSQRGLDAARLFGVIYQRTEFVIGIIFKYKYLQNLIPEIIQKATLLTG